MSRIDALIKSINKYFAPDPDNKDGTRKYALFSAKIEPVTLGISYAYQYMILKMVRAIFMVYMVLHFSKHHSDLISSHLYVHTAKWKIW